MAVVQPTTKQHIFGHLAFVQRGTDGYLATWELSKRLGGDGTTIHVQIFKHEHDEALDALIAEGLVEEVSDLQERFRLTAVGWERYLALAKAIHAADDELIEARGAQSKAWRIYHADPSVEHVLLAHAAEVRSLAASKNRDELHREVGIGPIIQDDEEEEA